MDAWIHFNEQVRNPVGISCALKANLSRCMYIFSTPINVDIHAIVSTIENYEKMESRDDARTDMEKPML
jgi:hypothetical protein